MISESWLEDEAVKNWMLSLSETETRTKKNYRQQFPKFLEWLSENYPQYETPSQIIKDKEKSKKHKWESIIVKFKNHMETQINPKSGERLKVSSIKSYIKCVQSFFSHNDERLMFRRNELKIEPSEEEKTSLKWCPINEEVRVVYRHCKTARDRALLLVMYQSGYLPSDIVNMKIENFRFYDNEGKWQIPETEHYYHYQRREKTDQWQITCLSYECIGDIQQMLKERGSPKEGSLFVSFRNKPLDEREINMAIKSTVKRAFPERIKEWKTKNLRDSYEAGLLSANITEKLKSLMFGHKPIGASSFYGSPQVMKQPITQAYQKAFKWLAINGFGSRTKIEVLEQEFRDHKVELAEIIANQNQEIKKLEQALNTQFLKTMEAVKLLLAKQNIEFKEET